MAFRARNVFGTFEKWAPGTGLVKVLNLNDAIKDVQQQIKQEYKRAPRNHLPILASRISQSSIVTLQFCRPGRAVQDQIVHP